MSYDEVFAATDARDKSVVMHDTWGHLFPKGDYYEGTVRIAYSIYGNIVILDEKIDIEGSAWWHDALTEFADNMVHDMKSGDVCEFKISVNITDHIEDVNDIGEGYEPKEWTTIDIKHLTKTYIVKAF